MAFVFRPPKRKPRIRVLKQKEKDLFQRLEDFIENNEPELVRLLESTWTGQQNLLTYEQIQNAYLQGDFSGEVWLAWEQIYSEMILEKMVPLWEAAVTTAVLDISGDFSFTLLPSSDFGGAYYKEYGANLVTNMVGNQREALRNTLWQLYQNENITATAASYYVRPLIGLTNPQMASNAKYYNTVLSQLQEEFPNMSRSQTEARARTLAEKYAAKQHRYRAQMIARTELATLYNAGHDIAVDEAIAMDLLPDMDSIWITTGTENVCERCLSMEGERVPKGKAFSNGVKYPPAHPHCGCAVMYEPREDENSDLTNGGIGGNMETGDGMKESKPSYTIDANKEVHVDLTPTNYTSDLLPNLANVMIPTQKLTGYALNPNHDKGKHKAIVFQSALGYNLTNYEDLLDKIIINSSKYSAIPKGDNGFGEAYQVDFPVLGPNGKTAIIQTGWVDDKKINKLRLVTVLVK